MRLRRGGRAAERDARLHVIEGNVQIISKTWWIGVFLAIAVPISAQQTNSRGASIDVSIGMSRGVGGDYGSRPGFASTLSVAIPVLRAGRSELLAGVGAFVQGNPMAGLDDCDLRPDGSCRPRFPFLAGVSPEIRWNPGVELLGLVSIVVRAGVGAVWSGERETSGVSGHGQIDLVRRANDELDLLLSFRGTVLPSFDGARLGVLAMLVGFRIW